MKRLYTLLILCCALFLNTGLSTSFAADSEKPNIIFILADDLGYGDLGCYGQKIIKTPHLDNMAAEGMKFTQFYAGSTVCAPSRCVLMTGLHVGHCRIRGNGPGKMQALTPQSKTVAKALQNAGYETALFGKWGLGDVGEASDGLPNKQGFDHFFGYYNQHRAHNYYPEYLWDNDKKFPLCNVSVKLKKMNRHGNFDAGYASKKVDYSHDLFMNRAIDFLKAERSKPFYLFLPFTIPHANNEGGRGTGDGQEVPDYGIYTYKDWPNPDKGQAAMITRMDFGIGEIFSLLKERGLDENTLVIFTSDNGHHLEGGNNPEFFDANGPVRGMKRDMYEGGIRVPMIARWPGKIEAGKVSDHISYFGDFFATATELANAKTPENLDSISMVPELTGNSSGQKKHSHLYWEFYERGSKQAVRKGKWKAIRMPMFTGKVQLYDLSQDLAEESDVASAYPKIVDMMTKHMEESHTHSDLWKVRGKKK